MEKEKELKKVLAVETSCDETGVAVIERKKDKINVLANELASQVELHRPYGGVYPNIAIREHNKNLPLLFKKIVKKNNPKNWNGLAVTIGPGLEPCLWEGVNFIKSKAKKLNLPVIPVNHMEAHIVASFIKKNTKLWLAGSRTIFPAVALLASGGHTLLVLVKKPGKYKILGETRDDAAGECFDKCARILGLPYPGGPSVAKKAGSCTEKFQPQVELPRPLINDGYDFSFSGLKTAVLYDHRSRPEEIKTSKNYIKAMAYEIQQAIVDVLVKKTIKALRDYKCKAVILGGGVSANKKLRKTFRAAKKDLPGISLLMPDPALATDNAVMIGAAALLAPHKKLNWKEVKVNAKLRLDKN